ncbi:MAG: metallophosphoesterase [Desulfomicrobium sp.]|nr:metallophosphoesterase [Pseudomonadota bacterium]MBV1713321.1 metallophosphoesterase [Desulfomicrobium sp.]MBU4570545.1 metallophosphoesterase [Pseudomonadota bacterium]MBU4593903.1 metallophosphoesterase [Pseudomonadota bacterium]MBV1719442.1 metallophosphoesterase [Desulfomicrobium sp.]
MILFAGDCHGDFVPLIEEAGEASAVVLLGDQEPMNDLAKELGPGLAPKTLWIYGNHDSDYLCYFENHAPMVHHNLHCRLVEIEGVRIAGLGGVFRAKKFEIDQTTRLDEVDLDCLQDTREAWITLRRGGRPYPADYTSIFPDDIKSLLALAGHVDVLVTHEAPESHALGYQLIGDLARAMGVKMIIHGHHHERYSATITDGIRVEDLGLARTNEGFFWLDHGLGERP